MSRMFLLFDKESKMLEFADQEAKTLFNKFNWSVKNLSDLCIYLSTSAPNSDVIKLQSAEFKELNFRCNCNLLNEKVICDITSRVESFAGSVYISVYIVISGFHADSSEVIPKCEMCEKAKKAGLVDYTNACFNAVFENASDAVILINDKGIIQHYNQAAVTLFGYKKLEVITKNISLLMPEPYKSEHDEYLKKYLSGVPRDIIHIHREVIAQHKDGYTFPIDLSVSQTNYDGKILFTGFIRDISKRKQTERELKTFFYMTHDLFCISNFDGQLLKFNQNWEKILGYTDLELNNLELESLFYPSDILLSKPAFKGMLGGVNINGRTVRLRCKDGSYRWFTWNCSTDLEYKLIYATATDITEQKNLISNLHNAKNKAEQHSKVIERMFKTIQEDLKAAGKIQKELLPSNELQIRGVDFNLYYNPCEHIGGDILDIIELDENIVAFYVIDVSGHGIKSALLAVAVHHLLSSWAGERNLLVSADNIPHNPAFIASELNREFVKETSDIQYFTMIYGLINKNENKFTYVRAGHTIPIIHKANGDLIVSDKGSRPIGLSEDSKFEEFELSFSKGDRLILYSDGLTEARGKDKDEFYGMQRLLASIKETKGLPVNSAVRHITKRLESWLNNSKPNDDIALIIIELK